ncbi:O-antigen ligase family protein [Dehalococcoidia bacterium]|nr:O-antigen ligase family protein [Dehalococcoidia bacterium]
MMKPLIDDILLFAIKFGFVLVLLTPLIVTPSTLFPYVVGKAIYARSVIEIVFACWVILAMRNSMYRMPRSWLLWIFGIYLVINVISAITGVSFQRSFWGDYRRMGGVFDLAHWFVFIIALASVMKETKQWHWLLNANLGISLMIAVLGLAQHYDIHVFDQIFWYLQPTSRVDVTFGNPAYLGAYMLVNVFIGLAYLIGSYESLPKPFSLHDRPTKARHQAQTNDTGMSLISKRIFWVTTLALTLWVFTLSGTRGAAAGLIIGLIVVGVVYAFLGNHKKLRFSAGILTGFLLLVGVVSVTARETPFVQGVSDSNVMLKRLERTASDGITASYESRLNTAQTGIKAFLHAPILGWGPENFSTLNDQYATIDAALASIQVADQAHNKPIEELATKGLLGFSGYAALLWWVTWVLIRTIRERKRAALFPLFMSAALLAYVIQNLFLFDTPGTFLQFALLLAWVTSIEVYPHKEPSSASTMSRLSSVHRPYKPLSATARSKPSRGLGGRTSLHEGFLGVVLHGKWRESTEILNASAIFILVVLIVGLYSLNYKPYHAAQLFPVHGTSMEQFLSRAQGSFQTFPPLATLSRQIMLDSFHKHWHRVPTENTEFFVTQLQIEGEAALRSEPHNARLYTSLASIHQHAGRADPKYLNLASQYVQAARMLAPNILATIQVSIAQDIAEGLYAEALTTIYSYHGMDPIDVSLNQLKLQAKENLREMIGEEEFTCRWVSKPPALTLRERANLEC